MHGICSHHLRQHVICPTLQPLGLWSLSAENLLLGTAAQESRMGHYLKQTQGPALGIYQMEPATYHSIKNDFLPRRRDLCHLTIPEDPTRLITDLQLATLMCRLKYLWIKEPLPSADDVYALAQYWKHYYNTWKGKGRVEDFIANYQKMIEA